MRPISASNGRARLILTVAFGAIVFVLILAQVIGYAKARKVQASVDLIAENALTSVRLVERMGLDVQRQRILVARHIFEKDIVAMDLIERQLAASRSDYAAASHQYVPIATFSGETETWGRLTRDVAAAEAPTATALALSRKNLDVQAQDAMYALEPTFSDIERDVEALVDINQAGAESALAAVRDIQRNELQLRLLLASIAVLIALVLGLSVTRMLSQRDAELRRYALVLEERNRDLDAFAGRVAHDLRGPLSTINLAAARIFERLPGDEGATAIFQRGVSRMENLIEDLLTLSRIDAHTAGMVAQIAAVAASTGEDLAPKVKDAGGVLRIDVEPAEVTCSEGLLHEVLWNLGENAVKYRRPDAPIEIQMIGRANHRDYEVRVSDNGAGMSPEDARRAFEPFFRSEQARAAPGTGLGLSIVKRIIEASGGTVDIDSQAGRGTTFVIKLPRR